MATGVQKQVVKRMSRAIGATHVALYRRTGGRIGGRIRGGDAMLLTVTGRRTGRQYTAPLLYVRDGADLVVAASNGGLAWTPTWWLNLQGVPEAKAQLGRELLSVRAEEVTGPDRDRLWRTLNEMSAGYDGYQAKRDTPIPVVRLRPSA